MTFILQIRNVIFVGVSGRLIFVEVFIVKLETTHIFIYLLAYWLHRRIIAGGFRLNYRLVQNGLPVTHYRLTKIKKIILVRTGDKWDDNALWSRFTTSSSHKKGQANRKKANCLTKHLEWNRKPRKTGWKKHKQIDIIRIDQLSNINILNEKCYLHTLIWKFSARTSGNESWTKEVGTDLKLGLGFSPPTADEIIESFSPYSKSWSFSKSWISLVHLSYSNNYSSNYFPYSPY